MSEKHYMCLLFLSFLLYIIFFLLFPKTLEPFTWNDTSAQSFLVTQHSMNPHIVFDLGVLQSQASQEEVDYFNENNKWPWSSSTTQLYETAIKKNPYIRTYSGDAVNYAQSIYNETAILTILKNQFQRH